MDKRVMRFVEIGILAIIIIFLINGCIGRPRETTAFEGKVKLRVAGDNNFKPYEYVDEKGRYRGFNVDIMKALGEVMDIEIEFLPMKWADAVAALENDQVDAIQGMSRTPEREKRYAFVQSTLINSHGIFIRKETANINGIDDLKGRKVGYQIGDVHEEKIKDIPNIISIPYDNQPDGLKGLLNEEVDAFIGNRITVIYYLNEIKGTGKVKIVGEPFEETAYGPATLKDNIETYRILDEGLTWIKEDGTYDRIYRKWFGDQLTIGSIAIRTYIKYIIIGLGIASIVFILLFLWNKRLQKEVSKRTSELEIANRDLKSQQDKIYYLAYFDPITNLPNRFYFIEALDDIIGELEEGEIFAVLCLDIDKFKHINDNLGHNIGDKVLKALAVRLIELIDNRGLVARGSGDEYFILLIDLLDESNIKEVANRIIGDFRRCISVEDYRLFLTTSIGIAIYPEAGEDSYSLIKNAEIALYKAKDLGGNTYFKYSKEMGAREYENLILLNELRQAVANDEFILYYQPKVDILTEEVTDMEALIRWNSPKRGLIFPDKFIPLAEETGLIFSVGEWVLREACRQNKEWIDKGHRPIRVSVNISARQFQYYNFLDTVYGILEETGLEPQYLGIEITETTFISDIQYTIDVLNKLKELGVFVIMDDFGIGYSNLSHLARISIDELKIDRRFIWELERDKNSVAIVNTIIGLAKQFGILVTAEGVETREQLEILRYLGCNKAQGYYFSRPIPPEEIRF